MRVPVVLAISLLLAGPAGAKVLITPEEAGLPPFPFHDRGSFPGPKVSLIFPSSSTGSVRSPFHLKAKFEPRGAKIDLDSLNVTYIKQQPVDLTDRVREFTGSGGIDMPVAEVPPGTHRIRIEIKDTDGVPGGTEFILKVAR
jgi:hypothetical protein